MSDSGTIGECSSNTLNTIDSQREAGEDDSSGGSNLVVTYLAVETVIITDCETTRGERTRGGRGDRIKPCLEVLSALIWTCRNLHSDGRCIA
jgi:hypothetical protein